MSHYFKKQFIIGFIWIVIFVVIIGGIYLLIKSKGSTCSDGIQNQNEEGIDCGGKCKQCTINEIQKQPEVLFADFIPTIENNYDLIARIKNSNINFGINSLSYVFELYDANEQIIASKQGKTYILPQETKYIVKPKIFLEKPLAAAEFKIKDVSFVKLENFQELDLKIKNRNHYLDENEFHKITGAIENKTSYDLDTIEVVGLLFDSNNKIIAIGRTEMNTVLMNETRGFEITWPYQISEPVFNFDVHVYTDVFSNENFIK